MTALLWLGRMAGLVPGWCWVTVATVLTALCVRLDAGMAHARADAAQARSELLSVQLASAQAISAEKDRAAARVRDLNRSVMEAQDALAQSRQAGPGRVAALDERLRNIARPLPCSGPTPAGGAAAPAGGGDGRAHPGLRGLDGADFVVLDGQAQHELAEFAVSSAATGEAVKACRSLLRECWRGP